MKKYQRPEIFDLTFELKEFLDYQHFYQMDRVHKIDESLYNCYPDPTTMDLMSKDGKTKAGFQEFLDKTVREFDDLVVQANNEKVIGVKDDAFIEFDFLEKKVKLSFKEQGNIASLLAFSKIKSNIDNVVETIQLGYLRELSLLSQDLKNCIEGTKLGEMFDRMFTFIAQMLERFQVKRVRQVYFPRLTLQDPKFYLDNDTLIMLLDKLIIAYTSPYVNLLYAMAFKLKPILSFYRPTTKPISLLDITLYSQELIMTYHLNGHPDPELDKLFKIVNSGKTYKEILEGIDNNDKKQEMIMFFKKYTYICDAELVEVLKNKN